MFSEPNNKHQYPDQNLSSEEYTSSDGEEQETSPNQFSSPEVTSRLTFPNSTFSTTTGESTNISPPQQDTFDSPQDQKKTPFATDENSNLAGNSCEHCKKVHRRCDRLLPSCSRCIKKGVECNYASPKKRGRPKKIHDPEEVQKVKPSRTKSQKLEKTATSEPLHVSDTPIITPNLSQVFSDNTEAKKQRNTITKQMEGDTAPYKTASMLLAQHEKNITNYKLQVAQLIDVYVQFISSGEVLLDREKAMAILNEKILNKSRGVVGDKKQRTAECLLTAIEAIALHRLGQSDEARIMFEKAKSLCLDSEIYEQHLDNFEVAAAMAIIALYLSGDPSKTQMCSEFLKNVNAFIENQRSKIKTLEEVRNSLPQPADTSLLLEQIAKLEKYVSCAQITLTMNHYNESEFNTPGLVNKLNIAAYCSQKFRFIDTETRRQILELINATKTTVETPIDKCENLCVALLQKKLSMLDILRDKLGVHLKSVPIVNLIWNTLIEGFHLELIFEYQRRIPANRQDHDYVQSQLMYYANRITKKILEESSWFQFGCTIQQRYVIMASIIHLRYVNTNLESLDTPKFGYTYEDIEAILKGDLWALEIILKLFPCKSETNALIVSIVQQLKNALQTLQLKHTLNIQKQQMEEMTKYLALSKLVANSNLGYDASVTNPNQQQQQHSHLLQQLLEQQLLQQQNFSSQNMEKQVQEKQKTQSILEQKYNQQQQNLSEKQQELLSQQHVNNFVSPIELLPVTELANSQSEYDSFLRSEDLSDLDNHPDLQEMLKGFIEPSQANINPNNLTPTPVQTSNQDTNLYFADTMEDIPSYGNFDSNLANGELSSATTSQRNLLDFFNDLDKIV